MLKKVQPKTFLMILFGALFTLIIGVALIPFTHAGAKEQPRVEKKVTIVQSKESVYFTPSDVRIPVGAYVVWTNHTKVSQVILDDAGKALKLAAGASFKQHFERGGGTYFFHLKSSPNSFATVSVLNNDPGVEQNTVHITPPSKPDGGLELSNYAFKLHAGDTLIWVNDTKQVQAVISDSKSVASVELKAGDELKMLFAEKGHYVLHLKNTPAALVNVQVD